MGRDGSSWNRGKGRGITFLREHVNYAGDECLTWPLTPDTHGYAPVGINGKLYKAHRVMCEMAHGPAPSSKHCAAHSCGNGHKACVNPRHLSWKTQSENQLDAVRAGTLSSKPGRLRWKINADQAARIRALKGKRTQVSLAAEFGISYSQVAKIHRGEAWKNS